jgi:biopolymer transport protein ExbD/biopolymer transport protein TolR
MVFKLKAPQVIAAPNVIPMADIMLVLLIIFMVVMPMIVHGRAVDMAKAENAGEMPDAEKEDAVIVAVTHDSHYFLSPGNKEIALAEISSDVKDLLTDKADKTMYVRSDSRAKYGDVVKAVDEIRSAGVENVGLLTEKIPPRNAPPVRQTDGSD